MSYVATVLRVMIASPSDVPEARDAVERAIHGWNDANARSKATILQPWRWETSSVPVLGDHPQALINAQGVDDSDIVFALFGSRLGSPTIEAVSGTVEEIERAVVSGKPVHLYFSTAQLPNDVDTNQLDGLRQFKNKIQEQGLLGEFSNPSQLQHEVWKAIEHDIATSEFGAIVPTMGSPGVDFLVQPNREREISGYDNKGKPRYRYHRWLEVTNTGRKDADQVTFESVGSSNLHLGLSQTPTTIHARQKRILNVSYTMGGGVDEPLLRIRWIENGQERARDFHVG